MSINEASRPYFEEMRALARDEQGREVLIGLTHDESEWYLAYVKNASRPHTQRELVCCVDFVGWMKARERCAHIPEPLLYLAITNRVVIGGELCEVNDFRVRPERLCEKVSVS